MELENNEVDLTDENLNVSLSEEEIQKIESASLEELFESLESIEDIVEDVEGEEAPVDDLGPAMESLMGMMEEIRHSGGISRSDASTLMNMTTSMEGFQDTFRNLPLASFTEVPSKVNYDVSMENIVNRTVKAIIEAIKRALKWIRDKIVSAKNWITGNRVKAKQADMAVVKIKTELKKTPLPTRTELDRVAEKAFQAQAEKFDEIVKELSATSRMKASVVNNVKEGATAAKAVEMTLDDVGAKLAGRVSDVMYDIVYNDHDSKLEDLAGGILRSVEAFLDKQDITAFAHHISVKIDKYAGGKVDRLPKVGQDPIPSAQEIDQLGVWITGKMSEVVNFSKARRSFEKVKGKDPLVVLQDIGTYLERVIPKGEANNKVVMRVLEHMDKLVKAMERSLAEMERSGDTEKLAQAQAIANFIRDRAAGVTMTAKRIGDELAFYRADMAKIVWEWNSSRLKDGQKTLEGVFG